MPEADWEVWTDGKVKMNVEVLVGVMTVFVRRVGERGIVEDKVADELVLIDDELLVDDELLEVVELVDVVVVEEVVEEDEDEDEDDEVDC